MKPVRDIELQPVDPEYAASGKEWVQSVALKIVQAGTDVGRAELFSARVQDGLEAGQPLFSLCDYAQATYDCGEAIFDFNLEEFRPKICRLFNNIPPTLNFLLIHRMEIEPEYRGKGVGLVVLLKVIKKWGRGCALAVIKPFPLQYEDTEGREKELRRDRRKLINYYSKLGFVRIPGTEFYALSLGDRLPTVRSIS